MAEPNGAPIKESAVEKVKRHSHFLRGTIAQTLTDPAAATFSEDDKTLLKFHGIYQQDDRDLRRSESGKSYSLMVRIRIPGGILTPEQWLVLDDLADRSGNGTLRITARQGIQFHGVAKGDLKVHIATVNAALMTTMAACGDVVRNVMAPAAPFATEAHRAAQSLAAELSQQLTPATQAYHEIWIDGEKQKITEEREPLYGAQYLPRKLKIGVALENDNSVDIYSYDCGLVGVLENGSVRGYNLLAGGGLGMTHNNPDTFARLASPIGFVLPEHAIEAVRQVVEIHRDFGNRTDRKHARIKHVIESMGLDQFIAELRGRIRFELAPPVPTPPPQQLDYIGLYDQGDGKSFLGVFVESGRVADRDDGVRYRSAFRKIVELVKPGIRLTPTQNILFTDLSADDVREVTAILHEHGVKPVEQLSPVRRFSMSCPALPTCGLALSEAERVLPGVIDQLERAMDEIGIGETPLTVRMTGCPNGCARPYNADIAFVGRKADVYHVFVGGGLAGDRLADLFAEDVPTDRLLETLRPLLLRFKADRQPGEAVGDFYQRILGRDTRRTLLTGKESPTQGLLELNVLPRREAAFA